MHRSSNTFAPKVPGTIDLEIADPVLILNEIARRYETTERVLMEYVDNALDDAEVLYRENGEAYPYPIVIEVGIDRANGTVSVLDNCRGMTREALERIVGHVGESRKRGQSWVNGRFGFGVHAFRAPAGAISFLTKHGQGSTYTLTLRRDQHRGIKEAKRLETPFPTASGTGCLVTLADFETEWLAPVTVATIAAEIEKHFEQIIARPLLTIKVSDADQAHICQPFLTRDVPGKALTESLDLQWRDAHYATQVALKLTSERVDRPPSFFARGRRIGSIAETRSFMRKSVHKRSVWQHPYLTGSIEVGDIVEPTINRDDFVRSGGRTILYDALLQIEQRLKAMLAPLNEERQAEAFDALETAVREAVAVTFDDGAGPALTLVADDHETAPRFLLADNGLQINVNHPDFQARLRRSRQGKPRPSDRLNAYLAGILAAYLVQGDMSERVETQIDLMSALEKQLRQLQG